MDWLLSTFSDPLLPLPSLHLLPPLPRPRSSALHRKSTTMAEGKARQSGQATTATQALLGKRPRQRMRRTTSMTDFSFENLTAPARHPHHRFHRQEERQRGPATGGGHGRSFSDFSELDTTARFLTACGLCNRRLGPGCDTFIYRGEIAFCSLECRQQRMNQEEQKTGAAATSTAASAETSGNPQTAVAS